MTKVLVTGGAGFIGSHIVDLLIGNNYKVVVVDNLASGTRQNLNRQAKFYELDILSPYLAKIFAGEKFDFVIHEAAQVDLRKSVDDPVFDARVNIGGSINILENCRKFKIKKIIFASSGGAIYGDSSAIPTPEDHPLLPVSPYGIGKLTVEHYLRFYNQVYGLKYTALRYANVYGPRQNHRGEAGVVAIFANKMRSGEKVVINGNGNQTRDFVFVTDVARANLLALESAKIGSFNIGTGKETAINELSGLLQELTHIKSPPSHGPAKKGEQMRSCLDARKAFKELKWHPQISLREGLELTVAHFESGKSADIR